MECNGCVGHILVQEWIKLEVVVDWLVVECVLGRQEGCCKEGRPMETVGRVVFDLGDIEKTTIKKATI